MFIGFSIWFIIEDGDSKKIYKLYETTLGKANCCPRIKNQINKSSNDHLHDYKEKLQNPFELYAKAI